MSTSWILVSTYFTLTQLVSFRYTINAMSQCHLGVWSIFNISGYTRLSNVVYDGYLSLLTFGLFYVIVSNVKCLFVDAIVPNVQPIN